MSITVFDPLKINQLTIPNRIARSATAERIAMQSESDGERVARVYTALAKGGVGLIISGHNTVHPSGRLYPEMAGLYMEENFTAWRRAIDLTRRAGGVLFLQLNHGGGRCSKSAGDALPAEASAQAGGICVSQLPDFPKDPMLGMELSDERIIELVGAFTAAVKKARELGADGAQVHAAHGYLVSQFLSPLTNRRTDNWGGSLENRARFIRLVIQKARAGAGKDFPLGVKLGACDDSPDGLPIEDTIKLAEWLEEDGLDFIEISGGFRTDLCKRNVRPGKNEGYYLPFAAQFKAILKIPVFCVGGIRTLEVMNKAIAAGQCDAVSMSRPLIRQPDLPLLLHAGGASECRGCHLCLLKRGQPTACQAKDMASHTTH